MTTAIKEMTLDEVKAEIKTIRPILQKAFQEAGPVLDMTKVTAFGEGLDERGKSERLAEMNIRLSDLGERKEVLDGVARGQSLLDELGEWLDAPKGGAPTPGGTGAPRYKSLADEADEFLRTVAKTKRGEVTIAIDGKDYAEHELKTVMSTGAGFAPQSIRSGVVVPKAYQAPTVIDLIPVVSTDQAAYVFMAQTTRTNAAAEIAESVQGDLKSLAESAFAWTQVTEPIQRIGHYVPVTDQQLKFVAGMRDILVNEMPAGVRERVSYQVLNGNGDAPNIEGFLDAGRATTDVDGTNLFVADVVDKCIEAVSVIGFATADAVVMHPSDWHAYRRTTTEDGIYIAGHPSEAAPPFMWGLPVALTTEIAQGSTLAGAFERYSRLVTASGIEVAVSTEHASYFIQGLQAIRAEMYATLAVLREAAFAKSDDIAFA